MLVTPAAQTDLFLPKKVCTSVKKVRVISLAFLRALLEPVLKVSSMHLGRNAAPVINGFLTSRGIIKEGYVGILSAPPQQHPRPLEIDFETPCSHHAEAASGGHRGCGKNDAG